MGQGLIQPVRSAAPLRYPPRGSLQRRYTCVANHEHITDFKWLNESNGTTGSNGTASMVKWIDV